MTTSISELSISDLSISHLSISELPISGHAISAPADSSADFAELSLDELALTTGGGQPWVPFLKRAGKVLVRRFSGPVGLAWSAYDGVDAYLDARNNGKSVGRSVWEGTLAAL